MLERHNSQCMVKNTALTLFEVIVETDTDFTLRMCSDCQPSFGLDTLFPQVDILLRTGVDNFDVCPLVGTGPNVCCYNYECVIVCWVPETFLLWPPVGLEIELDGKRW